jgi:hypothetical protein
VISLKQKQVLDIIRWCADEGKPLPSNSEMQAATLYASNSGVSGGIRRLDARNIITVRGAGFYRVITLNDTGKSTACPMDYHMRPFLTRAAKAWGIRTADIMGHSRHRPFTNPRFAIYAAGARVIGYGPTGAWFGADHSTVMSGARMAYERAERCELYATRLQYVMGGDYE